MKLRNSRGQFRKSRKILYTLLGIALIFAVFAITEKIDTNLDNLITTPVIASERQIEDDYSKVADNWEKMARELEDYKALYLRAEDALTSAEEQYNEAVERYNTAVDALNLHTGNTTMKEVVETNK